MYRGKVSGVLNTNADDKRRRTIYKAGEERIRPPRVRDAQSTSLADQMGRSAAKSGGPVVGRGSKGTAFIL